METEGYILFGEDSEVDACLMNDVLKMEKPFKTLCVVSNGFEILKHLQQIQTGARYPSLIVLNIDMPYLKGKETLELLKMDDIYRLIPVVMLSENQNFGDVLFYEGLKTEVYIKPDNFNEWRKMMNKACEQTI